MWLFYALLAAILWAVGQIFVKKGFQNTSAFFNNVIAAIFVFLFFVPLALVNGVKFDLLWTIAPLTIVAALLLLSYYYAIGKGELALTGTVIGTYPVVTVVLSLLFLHETLSLFQQLAIGLVIIGTVFITLPEKGVKFTLGSWLWWAIAAVFMLGTSDFLAKVLITQSNIYTYLFALGFAYGIAVLLAALFDKEGRKFPAITKKQYFPTIIGVGIIELGFLLFNIAMSLGYVSLVTPVAGSYVALTAILAWFILKEKIDTKHWFGITLAALGVILIGIT